MLKDEDKRRIEEHIDMYMSSLDNMFKEFQKYNWSNIVPSTHAAEVFFIETFITDEMFWDFQLIEKDFIKHCYEKLEEFSNVAWYENCDSRFFDPKNSIQKRILRLMLNGTKLGDEYCIALIKYLYKTYHRKEYNQLKKFSKINSSEVTSLIPRDLERGFNTQEMGRILTLCSIMGIEITSDCCMIYSYLETELRALCEGAWKDVLPKNIPEEIIEESIEQVDKWMEENKEVSARRLLKNAWRELAFVENCFEDYGYPKGYMYTAMEENEGIIPNMMRTLAVMKKKHPNKDYSFEEVQHYTIIYSAIKTLMDVNNGYNDELEILLSEFDPIMDDEYPPLFKPEDVVVNNKKDLTNKVTKYVDVAPVENEGLQKEDYLKEIDNLRQKLNQKEQKNAQLYSLYLSSKKERQEAESLLNKYENERQELIALRNFAYNIQIEEEAIDEKTVDTMKEAIKDKSVVIIGGHVKWLNKLKQMFPNWLLVNTEDFKQVDPNMLDGKERVYFYTDYISHSTYKKFISVIRERELPLGYLSSINIETVIKRIYNDII